MHTFSTATHTRTRTRTHARTHAHTHTPTCWLGPFGAVRLLLRPSWFTAAPESRTAGAPLHSWPVAKEHTLALSVKGLCAVHAITVEMGVLAFRLTVIGTAQTEISNCNTHVVQKQAFLFLICSKPVAYVRATVTTLAHKCCIRARNVLV